MTPDEPPPDESGPTRPYRPPADEAPTLPPNPHARPPLACQRAGNVPDGGRYQVLREHSPVVGGMGRVHRATDTELKRTVALKDIRPEYAEKPHFCEQFVLEAETTGQLEHPGVVPVYGFGRDAAGRPYYAMRFIDGPRLDETVRQFHAASPTGRERAVGLRQLLTRFVSVCQTVAFAHSKRVIHRDLKPANVMLGQFGETLVMDWGMVKLSGTHRPGTGTSSYWAPEQAEMLYDHQDHRTDVYGLGGILFHILTDRPPLTDGIHPPDPPSPRLLQPWVDGVLDAITRKALAHRPDDRYQSALELAKAVEEWLADQPVVAQRELVEKLGREAERQPRNAALAERLARERSNLGLMLSGMGRDGEAAGLFRDAADGYARLNGRRPEPRLQAEQANCLLAAARSLERIGGDALAEDWKQQAGELLRLIIATRPNEFEANEASMLLTHHGLPLPSRRPPPEPPPDDTVDVVPAAAAPDAPPAPSTGEPPADTPSGHTVPPPAVPRVSLRLPEEAAGQPFPELDAGPTGGLTPIREIGRGGMASVFLAWDNRLARLVAIKVLRAGSDAPIHHARFRREMRLTAALDHPNIVRVFSAGERTGGAPYMVMEHLDGASLSQRIREGEPGWTADRIEPFAQVCDALHFAHTSGIVHHDPKPANVILLANGRAVLHDWGLARRVADTRTVPPEGVPFTEEADPDEGAEGFIAATPAYMSPEQARGDTQRLTPASDIFSVGAGLFEAITGRRWGYEEGAREIMARVVLGQLLPLREVRPDVPDELNRIVTRAMAFRPEDRYESAAELAADLRAFLAGQAPPG